ncbi:MAG: hypothetical protein ACK5RQ_09540 [Bacteroidota bacterium]
MTESTKVISLRISQAKYDQILVECSERDMTITQWFETKIAIADNYSVKMQMIEENVLKLKESYERNPELARWRIDALWKKVSV